MAILYSHFKIFHKLKVPGWMSSVFPGEMAPPGDFIHHSHTLMMTIICFFL